MSGRNIKEVLFGKSREPTLYITLGNPLRSDDGVGPYIARKADSIPGIKIMDAKDQPERAIDWAMELRPNRLVFIDAADFGGSPGEIRDLHLDVLEKTTYSTHQLPLPAVMAWITHETGIRCHCIGIQLVSTELGEYLSLSVRQSADRLVDWLSINVTKA